MEETHMSDEAPKTEVKWWNKKLLIRSALVGLMSFGLFWGLAERVKPPEGYVFERLPAISGTYKCCESGGRYSKSWVGGIGINCSPIDYYEFLGTNRNDCGLKEQLNGRPVEVIRAVTPSLGDRSPLVVQISSNGQAFYQLNDKRLRELWISGSRISAFTLGFILAAIFHSAQLIYLDRKLNKSIGARS
jgi:hypothetical protein